MSLITAKQMEEYARRTEEMRAAERAAIEKREKQCTENMQKWEEGKTHFVEDVVSQQSSLDKSVINELNNNQPDVKRIGLVTKGNINKSDVYLSINENGDLIYDVVKNGKHLSLEIVKKLDSSTEKAKLSVTFLMSGNKFPQGQMSISTGDSKYVRFLPTGFVYNYGPDKHIYKDGSVSDEIDKLPALEKKTALFIRTYLFAETDLTLTKSEMIKQKEKSIQAEKKLQKQKKENELKQKQLQAKQKKKYEKTINLFLSDNKTNLFGMLVNKIRGKGK